MHINSGTNLSQKLRFIQQIIEPGDLVFDIGANIGQKLDLYLALHSRVVCVEPQPACLEVLHKKYHNFSNVKIIGKAVGSSPGYAEMYVCDEANVLSTLSQKWQTGRFAKYNFNRKITVQVITLDLLVKQWGTPKFCKIDVEGFESEVLKGLSNPIPYLSFELAFEFFENSKECLKMLSNLGYHKFNFAQGEKPQFVFPTWVSSQELIKFISSNNNSLLWGDIYAKHDLTDRHTLHPSKKQLTNITNNGECLVIEKFIQDGDLVFDVGANLGQWTNVVLTMKHSVKIHLFEPVLTTYHKLLQDLATNVQSNQIFPNSLALSYSKQINEFWYYETSPTLSTFHRRLTFEQQNKIKEPKSLTVFSSTVDSYCDLLDIRRINFLKIDVEGGEFDVLQGAQKFISKGKIDYIQFEYGGTYLDAKCTLKQVFIFLRKYRYSIFKIKSTGLEYLPSFYNKYEDYQYSNFLAVNERFLSNVLNHPPAMLDIQELCDRHSVKPKGVIHVGAHEGQEVEKYKSIGVSKIILIEANPHIFKHLQYNFQDEKYIHTINCAIADKNGTATLHVTSMDQSSSILPLKYHKTLYPNIQETHQVTVQSKTLDTLFQELQINLKDYNLLNLDIQGAELSALQGAKQWLQYVDAINTEVNYDELYEGCALIDEIDEFLEKHGFERVATTTPYHPSWGDAFYIKKPAIVMSSLGKNGRFANQIFQYAFLKIYAKEHNLRLETPTWIGQYLFGHSDPPISRQLPELRERTNELDKAIVPNSKTVFKNVDFWGYFQYNTKYYAPHKKLFRSLFQPVPEIERKMKTALERLRFRGKTIVGLHLRRGDYGYEHFFVAPNQWYRDWLSGLWETLDNPVLYIASDRIDEVVGNFTDYNPVTARDLQIDLPPQIGFYADFYILTKCDFVAISNSSFSFAACLLNERGKCFMRPHLSSQKLIPFDPWNSETLFRNAKVQDFENSSQQSKTPDVSSIYVGYEKIKDNPDATEYYQTLADILKSQGKKEAAKRAYLKAKEIQERDERD